MSEKRFERWNDHSCKVKDNQENTLLNWEDVVHTLKCFIFAHYITIFTTQKQKNGATRNVVPLF